MYVRSKLFNMPENNTQFILSTLNALLFYKTATFKDSI